MCQRSMGLLSLIHEEVRSILSRQLVVRLESENKSKGTIVLPVFLKLAMIQTQLSMQVTSNLFGTC